MPTCRARTSRTVRSARCPQERLRESWRPASIGVRQDFRGYLSTSLLSVSGANTVTSGTPLSYRAEQR